MFSNNLITLLPKIARQNFITRNVKLLHTSTILTKASTPDATDEPVQYSSSKAAQWSVKNTYGEPFQRKAKPPASQPYVVITSVLVFIVYFFILREENDLDENLFRPLSEHGIKLE